MTLFARDVSVRQILAEWELVGGTRIVNPDGAPGLLLTLDLADVPEARALATVLRTASGYLATARSEPSGTASQFARIIIMPAGAGMASLTRDGAQPSATELPTRPATLQVQRRVMADGRVVSFMENPDRPGDVSLVDDGQDAQPPAAVAAPAPLSQRLLQGQASADPYQLDPAGSRGPGIQTPQAPQTIPGAGGTAVRPGTVVPAPRKPPGI